MVIDTIFLCFAEDSKHNNGKDRPYFMSDALLKFMNSQASNEVPPEQPSAEVSTEKPKKVTALFVNNN